MKSEVSLFSSIPVSLALKIIKNKWNILQKYTNIPKRLFKDCCIKERRYFKYEGHMYEQKTGMPTGSTASPVIADIIMKDLLDLALGCMVTKPLKYMKLTELY